MGKLILVSVVFAPLIIAGLAARDPRPVRGFKRLLVFGIAFHILYVFAVLFVYPRFS